MVGTIPVGESADCVRAPMAGKPGYFYPGRIVWVRLTSGATDVTDPIEVREGLVGVNVRTIFDRDQLRAIGDFGDVVPEGARVAYAEDVAEALREAGNKAAADKMMEVAKRDQLALYSILPFDHEVLW